MVRNISRFVQAGRAIKDEDSSQNHRHFGGIGMTRAIRQLKTRNWNRIHGLWVAGSLAFAFAWVVSVAKDSFAAPRSSATASIARVSDIPSHNRAYRSSLMPAASPIGSNSPTTWIVDVRTAFGAPVEEAVLSLESRMPDDASVELIRPQVTAALGGGRYRVEGLHFVRGGWYNVKLRISAGNVTDSLAFNLVLK
jgi:hypothetical protein